MAENSKHIVITGVSRGLGRAMAEVFLARGHTVIGCARSEDSLRQLEQTSGGLRRFDVVDVADDGQVGAWAEQVIGTFGPPDILINGAAVINRNAPLWNVSAEEFSQVVDININGVVNVIRHFAPAMIERRQGVIVNFSSGWGRSASAKVGPYCATKWAVEGLTKSLAEELPRGMAAIPLNPGVINTEMLQSCFGEEANAYPSPAEWAESAVPYILGLSPAENGQSLSVPA